MLPWNLANRYDEIFSLSLGDRVSDIEIKRADDGIQILFLNTWENERKHQRLHFHATPQNATTALILHKRDFQPLVDDSSAPEIAGIETALEEFAMYDMRQAERQYSMAQQHFKQHQPQWLQWQILSGIRVLTR